MITRFVVNGVFGSTNIDFPLNNKSAVIVGPNGIGKSTILSMFYFFISKQWSRLQEFGFSEIGLHYDNGSDHVHLLFTKSEIEDLASSNEQTLKMPARLRMLYDKIRPHYEFRQFVRGSPSEIMKTLFSASPELAESRYFTLDDVKRLQFYVRDSSLISPESRGDPTFLDMKVKELSNLISSKIVYLPTYRRIEKDLSVIFPSFDVDMRARVENSLKFRVQNENYIELISFGMADVMDLIKKNLEKLSQSSLAELNSLAGKYLQDIINGEVDKYDNQFIRALTEDSIADALNRLEGASLSNDEKKKLASSINTIRNKKYKLSQQERYLAYYFSALVTVSQKLKKDGKSIQVFVDKVNEYILPDKKFVYDDVKYTLSIERRGKPFNMSDLSSGEKQVISMLAHLYLGDRLDYIVIIDEPELSLSVAWQRRFLADIANSGRCNYLLAVTHSPYIYSNSLKDSAFDLRRFSKSDSNVVAIQEEY